MANSLSDGQSYRIEDPASSGRMAQSRWNDTPRRNDTPRWNDTPLEVKL